MNHPLLAPGTRKFRGLLSRFAGVATFAAVCCLGAFAAAQLPVSQLISIFPPGGKPGATVEATINGLDLEDVDKLIFSHPGIAAAPKMSLPTDFDKTPRPIPNQFVITVAGDTPPGIYEARAAARFGQSNSRAFVVGNLNELVETTPNSTADKPADLTLGAVFSGRVDNNSVEFFKLPLKANERVLLECFARRIDSKLNATLVMHSPAGKELSRVHSTPGNDPVLDFTAPAEGVYLLKMFDSTYGGGPEYFYRLNVTGAAVVDFIFPPAALPGANAALTIYGRNLPGGQPADGWTINGSPLQKLAVNIPLPGDDAAKSSLAVSTSTLFRSVWLDAVEYRLPTPQGPANPVLIGFARAPVILEQEPNNAPSAAQKITLPCEFCGQFYPERDVDWVQFEAKKGETYWIDLISHRLGLETDPYFAIFRVVKNEKGEETLSDIAQVDDPPERAAKIGADFDATTDDPTYKFAVPEDGTYRLLLRDQVGDNRKNPAFVYRLAIRPAEPDFRLLSRGGSFTIPQNPSTPLTSTVLRKGGSTAIRVDVDRRDEFAGDILITIEGLPAGVTCPGAIISGDVSSAVLVISAVESAAGWGGPIKIVGKTQLNGKELVRESRYGQVIWGTPNRQTQLPEFGLTRQFQLTVIDKELQPVSVQIGEDKIWETSLGGNLEIPVAVTRRGDFKEPVKLNSDGLPDVIKPKELNLDGNTATGKLEIQINQQNTKPGVYTFTMLGDIKKPQYIRNPEAVVAADAEQKQAEEMLKQLAAVVQQATAAKDEATKQAVESVNAAKLAEQNKTNAVNAAKQKTDAAKLAVDNLAKAKEASAKDAANQGLKDAATSAQKAADDAAAQQKAADEAVVVGDKALLEAQAKAKTLEENRVKAEAALKAAQDKQTAANQFKQQLDQRVAAVKQANQPKDVNFSLISTPIKLKIVASPITINSGAVAGPLKQNEKQPLTVAFGRLYNFADAVQLSVEPPPTAAGVSANPISVPNGQAEGKLELVAAPTAAVGDHVLVVRAKGRFNNVEVQTTFNVPVKVLPLEKK